MKKIGVLTSGGDAPGMNACLRAVVRTALENNIETIGIRRGYAGMVANDTVELHTRDVGGIARWGGTVVQTARSDEFITPQGFQKALDNLRKLEIDGMVVIGGDGSLRGALELHQAGIPSVGVPGSIDNDVDGTDMAIGVDTATNTILETVDKIKDTASAHERAFVIEVMGRRNGYLALASGVAGGAEMVIVPERPTEMSAIIQEMANARERGKPHFIVIVAEGSKPDAHEVCDALAKASSPKFDARLTVLGHVQRGGSPSAFDRLLATRFGSAAVESLISGESGVMVGMRMNQSVLVNLTDVIQEQRSPDADLLKLSRIVSR